MKKFENFKENIVFLNKDNSIINNDNVDLYKRNRSVLSDNSIIITSLNNVKKINSNKYIKKKHYSFDDKDGHFLNHSINIADLNNDKTEYFDIIDYSIKDDISKGDFLCQVNGNEFNNAHNKNKKKLLNKKNRTIKSLKNKILFYESNGKLLKSIECVLFDHSKLFMSMINNGLIRENRDNSKNFHLIKDDLEKKILINNKLRDEIRNLKEIINKSVNNIQVSSRNYLFTDY